MKRVLGKIAEEEEFFSPHGLRSLSKYHQSHPFFFDGTSVSYEPGESFEKIKGGNSNWRGPIWMPINFIFLTALRHLIEAVGKDFVIVSSSKSLTLEALESSLRQNLIGIFRKDKEGKRPANNGNPLFQNFPDWKRTLSFL